MDWPASENRIGWGRKSILDEHLAKFVKRISAKREEKGGGPGSGGSFLCCLGFMVIMKGQEAYRIKSSLFYISNILSLEVQSFVMECVVCEKNRNKMG